MPSQIDNAGFEDLRTYIQNNWPWVAVLDGGGTEHLRWDASSNSNASWSSGPAGNPLEAQLVVSGQDLIDAGATLPITLTLTESYKTSSATTRMGGDPYTDATLEAPNDEVVITHQFSLPP